jgi:hypothetical protein
MERKEAVYKGLEFIPVFYVDDTLTSPDYFQISEFPTRLTAGKNLFKLRGHPTNLRVGGVLGIEVLDYNGDPIYSQVLDYIDEDNSRVIAIYIYEDTSPGDCSITLIAEANTIEGAPAPAEWQGKPNIRWTRTVPVNPMVANVSEIIFEKLPTVNISEEIGVQLDRQYTNGQFPTYTTGTVKLTTLNGQPVVELTGGEFESDMKTGTITVASPVNPSPTPAFTISTTPYVSTIKKILTPTTALLDKEYIVYSSESIFPHIYTEFEDSAFSLSYEATPTYVTTENSQSFALVEIENLDPGTGDVSRVKIYTNNKGTVGDYEQINDVELTETEILVVNTASLFPDQSVGTFVTQSTIDTYWEGHTYLGRTESTAPTLTWTTESLDLAALIDSSTDITANNHVLTFQPKDAYQGLFIATSSYKVTVDALGTRSTVSSNNDPVLGIYMSGSAFDYDTTDLFNQELPKILGKRIGELRVTDSNSERFDDVSFSFESNKRGNGVVIFVVESGVWQISDVRTTTDNDVGYTPNYTRLKTFVETTHKIDNQITFKIEYYNVDGVASKQINYVYDKNWEGGNRYVDGNFSMLTGSLYVADSLESGVAISGYPNSGFVRSLGYEGFAAGYPGFLLWSGSALPGSAGTKGGVDYTGVGLEMYANTESYFRYATDPSEIDIRTDKFFFGNPSSSFISGSNGVIEISASNFVLSAQGDVTASNALFTGTALANAILNKTVTITAANSGSYLDEVTADDTSNTPAYNLVLDGSNGGEIATSVNISCVLNRPIFKYVIPDYGSGAESTDIRIENNSTNTKILNTFITKGGSAPSTYDQLEVTDGAILILAIRGTNLATQNSYPIAGSENISGLSTGGYLIRRNLIVGDGEATAGTILVSSSNDPKIQFRDTLSNDFTIGNEITSETFQIATSLNLDNTPDSTTTVALYISQSHQLFLPQIESGAGTSTLKWDSTTKKVTHDTSTAKTKTNIKLVNNNIIDDVLKLTPKQFSYKTNTNIINLGLIAEDVAQVNSIFAVYGPDIHGDIKTDNIVPVNIDDRAIIAALIGKVQDLEFRLKQLETK